MSTADFYRQIHWIVPTIAGSFLIAFLMLIFVSCVNYLTDVYVDFAASVMAANTFARSIGCACAPLFTNAMFRALGVGIGGSVIGAFAAVLAIIPFVFYRYGKRIRSVSRYTALEMDTVVKDEENSPTPSNASIRAHPSYTISSL